MRQSPKSPKTNEKKWIEVRLDVENDLRDAVSNRLFEIGAEGVCEFKEHGKDFYQAFFPEDLKETVVSQLTRYQASLKTLFPAKAEISFQVLEVPEDNWSEKYKEFYKAQKLTHLFFLKPAWDQETQVPNGMIPLIMDPGQAFGTGLHPSTRMCVHLLEQAIKAYRFPEKLRMIDVGTGTGILAMVAKHLHVESVDAVDNDPVAVETAIENFELNGCKGINVSDKDFSTYTEQFDIIVSNILLETHRLLAADYARLLKDGGQLILSGLLAYQKNDLESFLFPLGFVPMGSCNFQEWGAYSYTCRPLKS